MEYVGAFFPSFFRPRLHVKSLGLLIVSLVLKRALIEQLL
jgi:hypothetical protein